MNQRRNLVTATLLCALALAVPPALAAGNCASSCAEQVADCKRTECAALRGEPRHACAATCRGRTGCGARIRTLAYVMTECREVPGGLVGRQMLMIRRGDCEPVAVMEITQSNPLPDPFGLCQIFGDNRSGDSSPVAGVFQRLGVSADGSAIVFEVTDDHSILPLLDLKSLGVEEGFFYVRADGSGLRSLGPASRDPTFLVTPNPSSPSGFLFVYGGNLDFSPDGRTIVFTDLGPSPTGEDAQQIVTIDVASGRRRQVTRLPPVPPLAQDPTNEIQLAGFPTFLDDQTIQFYSYANPDGLNPESAFVSFTVRVDGTRLRARSTPVAIPGSRVVPTFQVAGGGRAIVTLLLPGTPLNPRLGPSIAEAFLVDGEDLIQLTNFRRSDTVGEFLDVRTRRALFTASVDPFGLNPSQSCQFFSVDTLGRHVRQVTHFPAAGVSELGCAFGPLPGCSIATVVQDPVTGTVVFYSSCDPFGTTPNGGQLFAMQPDGSRLRQLTDARGLTIDADGLYTVELPGPVAHAGR